MSLAYFKRFRMEISLTGWLFPCPALPRDYCLLPWDGDLVEAQQHTKYLSFRHEIDASVFPCLGQRDGCQRLMAEIAHRETFVPEATWLLACRESGTAQVSYCGTVQGLRSDDGLGAVQNLGIIPGHRGQGLGTYLLMRNAGFSFHWLAPRLSRGDGGQRTGRSSLPAARISQDEDPLQGGRGCVCVAGRLISEAESSTSADVPREALVFSRPLPSRTIHGRQHRYADLTGPGGRS